jgi:hypothetical protein
MTSSFNGSAQVADLNSAPRENYPIFAMNLRRVAQHHCQGEFGASGLLISDQSTDRKITLQALGTAPAAVEPPTEDAQRSSKEEKRLNLKFDRDVKIREINVGTFKARLAGHQEIKKYVLECLGDLAATLPRPEGITDVAEMGTQLMLDEVYKMYGKPTAADNRRAVEAIKKKQLESGDLQLNLRKWTQWQNDQAALLKGTNDELNASSKVQLVEHICGSEAAPLLKEAWHDYCKSLGGDDERAFTGATDFILKQLAKLPPQMTPAIGAAAANAAAATVTIPKEEYQKMQSEITRLKAELKSLRSGSKSTQSATKPAPGAGNTPPCYCYHHGYCWHWGTSCRLLTDETQRAALDHHSGGSSHVHQAPAPPKVEK